MAPSRTPRGFNSLRAAHPPGGPTHRAFDAVGVRASPGAAVLPVLRRCGGAGSYRYALAHAPWAGPGGVANPSAPDH